MGTFLYFCCLERKGETWYFQITKKSENLRKYHAFVYFEVCEKIAFSTVKKKYSINTYEDNYKKSVFIARYNAKLFYV